MLCERKRFVLYLYLMFRLLGKIIKVVLIVAIAVAGLWAVGWIKIPALEEKVDTKVVRESLKRVEKALRTGDKEELQKIVNDLKAVDPRKLTEVDQKTYYKMVRDLAENAKKEEERKNAKKTKDAEEKVNNFGGTGEQLEEAQRVLKKAR